MAKKSRLAAWLAAKGDRLTKRQQDAQFAFIERMGVLARHYIDFGRKLTPAEIAEAQHMAARIIRAYYREGGLLLDVNTGLAIQEAGDTIMEIVDVYEGGVMVGLGFEVHGRAAHPSELAEAAKPLDSFLKKRPKAGNLK